MPAGQLGRDDRQLHRAGHPDHRGLSHAAARAAARARSTMMSVTSACQRVAAIARLSPAAGTTCPAGRPAPLTASLRQAS